MKIDIHAHIVDRRYVENLTRTLQLSAQKTPDGKTLFRHKGYTLAWSRDDMFDIDERLRQMDRKGIDVRVLSLSTPNVYLWDEKTQIGIAREVNDAMARICRAHPDRFVGLASLPLKSIPASLEELDRAINELGMKGVTIGSNVDGLALDDPRFEPIWKRIDELRLPVFEHPMFPETTNMQDYELPLRVGLIFDTTLVAARLIYSGVFERYPNFPYIMAHTGGALLMILERLDNGYRMFPDCRRHISRLPSVYASRLFYDTTAFGAIALKFALESVGSSQILFGTDDPFIDADATHVERIDLDEKDRTAILSGNARRLIWPDGK